jgi:hypothetical protein
MVKVKIEALSTNKRNNLVLGEVLEGTFKGCIFHMWLGESDTNWSGKELKVGDIVEGKIEIDEIGEEYLQFII